MKKMKIWLIVAAILSVVGLTVLAISLVGVGFDFEKIDNVNEVIGVYDPDGEFDTVFAELETADIRFLPSEDGKVKVVCHEREDVRHSVSVQDGKLVIRYVDDRSWFDMLTLFYFGKEVITVYLPEDLVCTLKIETDTGDVTLGDGLSFGMVQIETDTGDVVLKNCRPGTTDIETDTGDITVSSVAFSGALGIFTDTGDIELKKSVVSGDVNIETDTGDIAFERFDAENLYLVTDTGDMEGTLLSDKCFDVKTKTGDKEIHGSNASGGLCKIRTDTGDIEIDIVK